MKTLIINIYNLYQRIQIKFAVIKQRSRMKSVNFQTTQRIKKQLKEFSNQYELNYNRVLSARVERHWDLYSSSVFLYPFSLGEKQDTRRIWYVQELSSKYHSRSYYSCSSGKSIVNTIFNPKFFFFIFEMLVKWFL